MHVWINHTIRINYINFKHLHVQIHISMESPNGMGLPSIHMLPMYIRYKIIIGTNHTYNNARISLPK